jgi:hypothetical protein
MQYTYITPPASRAADRPSQIDDALVAEARRVLTEAVASLPPGVTLNRESGQSFFAIPMSRFCDASSQRPMPVEKLIVAIKLAWGALPEARLRFGESASDALSAAVSACIDAYYAAESRTRAQ